jgi:hypothetical protein
MEKSDQVISPEAKKENIFLNIGFNILMPIFVLNKGQKLFGKYLDPYFNNVAITILLIALLFPIAYFIYDYYKRAKFNLISIVGLISVLLTGGISIMEIPTRWFAIKEAAIPSLLGIAVVVSLKTPWPLIRTLLYNPEIINVDKVHQALQAHGKEPAFEKLLTRCTWLLAFSFLLSGVINYILARWMVVSQSGTDAFNTEVSRMWFWSWPAIIIPSLIITSIVLWLLLSGIQKMTGLKFESILAIENNSKTEDTDTK